MLARLRTAQCPTRFTLRGAPGTPAPRPVARFTLGLRSHVVPIPNSARLPEPHSPLLPPTTLSLPCSRILPRCPNQQCHGTTALKVRCPAWCDRLQRDVRGVARVDASNWGGEKCNGDGRRIRRSAEALLGIHWSTPANGAQGMSTGHAHQPSMRAEADPVAAAGCASRAAV